MMFIKKDATAYDSFYVEDEGGDAVTGLLGENMTKRLWNPRGTDVGSTLGVDIDELGNGFYQAAFVPNMTGPWTLGITESTHFPWGKGGTFICVENLFDDIAEEGDTTSQNILELLKETNTRTKEILRDVRGTDSTTQEILEVVRESKIWLSRMLGLMQENFRMRDIVVDSNGNLTSATIRVYGTAADAQADTNHIAQYAVTASYSGEW